MLSDFPSVNSAIRQGIERGLHTGVQIYVSVDGQPVMHTGIGAARSDRAMSDDTIMAWRSAGKPLTAAAICQLWEQGTLSLESPLTSLLPARASSTVAEVTVRQILTHTSGLPLVETGWPHDPWSEIISDIYDIGDRAASSAYQPQATWYLLGEILQHQDPERRRFPQLLTDTILRPLGIRDVWCGLPPEILPAVQDRLPRYYERKTGQLVPGTYGEQPWLTQPSPGGNLRGPVRELGRFYEMLLNNGRTADGETLLRPDTVRAMTTRHRISEFDQTFQHVVDFGLGLIIDSNHHGDVTVPYGFGRYCSPDTFGHGGAQCAMGFCDPAHGLVVAWAANGFCGEPQHQRRNRAINEAVYTDLGLTGERPKSSE